MYSDTNVNCECKIRYCPTTKTTGWIKLRYSPIDVKLCKECNKTNETTNFSRNEICY